MCTESVFGIITPQLKIVTLKVWDDLDWNILTVDAFMDSKSILAINSYGRPAPPAKVLFCGELTYEHKVIEWRPSYFGPNLEYRQFETQVKAPIKDG